MAENQQSSSNFVCCRVCYEDETTGMLIQPCKCSGTIARIHKSCLETSLSKLNRDCCEICGYNFPTERRKRPLLQSVWQWARSDEAEDVAFDVVCLLVLTLLCIATTYFFEIGTFSYKPGVWDNTGLAILGYTLIAIYFVWLIVTVSLQCKSWQTWSRNNQDVVLVG